MTDTARVPPGHHVKVHRVSAEPGVVRTEGGVIVAGLGSAGDDPDRELAEITSAVNDAVRIADGSTVLATAHTLSDLFAPADPPVVRVRSPVIWTFHMGGVASLYADSRRADALLEFVAALRAQQLPQIVYVIEAPSRAVLDFVGRLRGLAIEVRRPPDANGSVLVEVMRPEGIRLSAHLGVPFDQAAATREEPLVPFRSPLVSRLVRELHATRSSNNSALRSALKARTLPLLLIVDPSTRGVSERSFGNVRAIPVFSD
jgi:hypothetical protein